VLAVRFSRHFERKLVAFRRKHPELAGRLGRVLRDLDEDPYRPRLRLHALSGAYAGQHAVSVTHEHRIRLLIIIRDNEIELLDIGTHDEVYG
jgi:mRNA-degrading endonuclease YafQ of YafQ-DinJ toxin-antitoxin module